MFSNFKTRLRKWTELRSEDFFNLIGWSPTKLEFDSRTIVASAAHDGAALAYVTAQPVFIVSAYALKPEATPSELQKCGDAIDKALEVEAQRVGIGKVLIELPEFVPPQPGERIIRVISRSIPQPTEHNEKVSHDWQQPEAAQSAWIN